MTDTWELAFNAAVELRDSGQVDLAIQQFAELEKDHDQPENHRAAVLGELGGLYLFDIGDAQTAESYFRQCVALSPRSELASLGLFHSLADQRRLPEALDEMSRYVSLRESKEYTRLLEEIGQAIRRSRSRK